VRVKHLWNCSEGLLTYTPQIISWSPMYFDHPFDISVLKFSNRTRSASPVGAKTTADLTQPAAHMVIDRVTNTVPHASDFHFRRNIENNFETCSTARSVNIHVPHRADSHSIHSLDLRKTDRRQRLPQPLKPSTKLNWNQRLCIPKKSLPNRA
jgi:hypothetical protein